LQNAGNPTGKIIQRSTSSFTVLDKIRESLISKFQVRIISTKLWENAQKEWSLLTIKRFFSRRAE
jgi:hypothetical protein